MTMTFSFHENIEFGESNGSSDVTIISSNNNSPGGDKRIHLFAEKLVVPSFKKHISRPRLKELLKKSAARFGATLITGRAGTGKSALAAEFAREYEKIAWFSIESADCDWDIFSRYLVSSFDQPSLDWIFASERYEGAENAGGKISQFVENLFSYLTVIETEKPLLLVLDDIHNIFDAEWFAEFFNSLLYSLPMDTHLLLLSRSQPAVPLWRLRSKQVLGVVDEKILAFNEEETRKLFQKYGLSKQSARQAFQKSFGRISQLKILAEKLTQHSRCS